MASRLPSSRIFPGPAAMISPSWGFSFAVSGRTMPLFVISSRALGLMTTRSPSGLSFVAFAVALANVLSSCFGQGRPRASDSWGIGGRVMAGWSDGPETSVVASQRPLPDPPACLSRRRRVWSLRAALALSLRECQETTEPRRALSTRVKGAEASAAGPEVQCELHRVAVARQRGAAGSVVPDIPAELPLRFVVQHQVAEAPRRVGDGELARAVVCELPDVILEGHPAEHDLQCALAVEVDGEAARATGERWCGDVESSPGGSLRFERTRSEREPHDVATGRTE